MKLFNLFCLTLVATLILSACFGDDDDINVNDFA